MSPDTPSLFVFSHPNHELAVYGLIQHLDPWMVYLTDGGGQDRVDQTLDGLSRIGRLEKAVFLDHPEKEFYDRLLAGDSEYFRLVAEQVAIVMATRKPVTVCSDAIEYYNPVHDLAAPITRAALAIAGLKNCRHYEVPLVHQAPDSTGQEKYLVQRLPVAHADSAVVHTLPQVDLEAKGTARDEVYSILAEQFGTALTDLSMEHLGHEVLSESSGELKRGPGDAYVLRYEWRARALLESGAIQEMITLADHFQPVAEALLSGSEAQKTPQLPLSA